MIDRRTPGHDVERTAHDGRVHAWLTRAETLIYVAIAALLSLAGAVLLAWTAWRFVDDVSGAEIGGAALLMLDRLLLVLMLVELLYTVRASLETLSLVPEPFLIVGLIAAVRRILVITAEAWNLGDQDPDQFNRAMIVLGLLSGMILVIVVAVVLLRKFRTPARGT